MYAMRQESSLYLVHIINYNSHIVHFKFVKSTVNISYLVKTKHIIVYVSIYGCEILLDVKQLLLFIQVFSFIKLSVQNILKCM